VRLPLMSGKDPKAGCGSEAGSCAVRPFPTDNDCGPSGERAASVLPTIGPHETSNNGHGA
jgi:hypothetical protein